MTSFRQQPESCFTRLLFKLFAMIRYQLLFACWLCFTFFLEGQTTFNRRYHFDTPATYLTSVVPTDSCYYATGIYADTLPFLQVGSLFVKLDLEGNPVFVKKLISPEKSYETRTNTLTALEDGTFVVTGLSFDPVMKGMLIKYNKNGDTIWTKDYLNPFFPVQEFMHPLALARMPDDGFVLACWTNKSTFDPDIYLIRTDSLGNKLWSKFFGNSIWDQPGSILTTNSGDIIVGGVRTNLNSVVENYFFQCHIFQTDSLGNLQWDYLSTVSDGLRDAANDMVLLGEGNLVIASGLGTEVVWPSVNQVYFDKMVFELSSNQQIKWERTFKEKKLSGSAVLSNVINTFDGSGFVIAGKTGEDTPGDNTFAVRGWIGKVSPEGDSLWAREYVGVECDNPRHQILDIKETTDGGFILCGESRNLDATNIPQQAWLLKLDQYGCLIPGCHLTDAVDEEKAEPDFHLAIYPNPARDYLNFYLRHSGVRQEVVFRIINAAGQVVREFQGGRPGATYIVPVWDWAPGVYFLQYLEEGQVRVSEKFIKQ